MKRKAWQHGRVTINYPRLWGARYEQVYLWDEVVGFRLRFGFGRWFSEYTSRGAL